MRGHHLIIAMMHGARKIKWLKMDPSIKFVPFEALKTTKVDGIITTYWETQQKLMQTRKEMPPHTNFYFIQQLEDRFFPEQPVKQKAVRETYYDIVSNGIALTEAKWLKKSLRSGYGIDATYIPNKQELPERIKEKWIGKKRPIVLFEGDTLTPNKGYLEFLEVMKSVRRSMFTPWLLTNRNKSMIPANKLFFEKIFAERSWEDALSVIKTADIIVKPTHFEGSPTPIMEAMELGTIIVAYDCDGMSEYCVNDQNAILVPVGDTFAMSEAIIDLLTNPKKRWMLSQNGVKTSEGFNSWDPAIDDLERVLLDKC